MKNPRIHPCDTCNRKCRTPAGVVRHKEDVHGDRNFGSCSFCSKAFARLSSARSHEETCNNSKFRIKPIDKDILCEICNQWFRKEADKEKHEKESGKHKSKVTAKNNLCERFKKVAVNKTEAKSSLEIIEDIIKRPLKELHETYPLFTGLYRKAGSVSTNSKIGKPDEYDFDLIIDPFKVHNDVFETVDYDVECENSLNIPATILYPSDPFKTPMNYVGVKDARQKWLIPRQVQEIIFNHFQNYDLNKKGISCTLSNKAHGPAVTLNIKREINNHDISVDLSASIRIPTTYDIRKYDWPRHETRKTLKDDLVYEIITEGLHVVPKTQRFWYISVSLAEKMLMNKMDSLDNGCRKECHKLIKREMQIWKSHYNFNGISTIIFKHSLFWLNEEKPLNWSKQNVKNCFLETLRFARNQIKERKLLNYFRESEDFLKGKNEEVLKELVKRLDESIRNNS